MTVAADLAPQVAAAGQAPIDGPKTADTVALPDVLPPEPVRKREKFLPVTLYALFDRLTMGDTWAQSGGRAQAKAARRFFRYLEHWRRQQHTARLSELLQAYESFSPDSDLLVTRRFTAEERAQMQRRVVDGVKTILEQANYERIDPEDVAMILTKESHYGLDLDVDFTAFEEVLIFYRGASSRRDQKRNARKFWRKEEFDVPIFQRLLLLFKLKPFDVRVREVMEKKKISRNEAEKVVKRLRAMLPAAISDENIYIKLFKNIPRSDIEMVFPNTRVKFRLLDKLRLGLTAGGGLGMSAVGAAGKLAVAASNPVMAAGAVVGIGGVAFRQAINFLNQKQRYMVVMAQNLYFHSMADNRGVMIKLADRAAEEDIKEEVLLYSVLAKEVARREDLPAIDHAIENYLKTSFGVSVNFDLEDALDRLIADGIVTEAPDGRLITLPPKEAALHLDAKWDQFLDNITDEGPDEGQEFEGIPGGAPGVPAPPA